MNIFENDYYIKRIDSNGNEKYYTKTALFARAFEIADMPTATISDIFDAYDDYMNSNKWD